MCNVCLPNAAHDNIMIIIHGQRIFWEINCMDAHAKGRIEWNVVNAHFFFAFCAFLPSLRFSLFSEMWVWYIVANGPSLPFDNHNNDVFFLLSLFRFSSFVVLRYISIYFFSHSHLLFFFSLETTNANYSRNNRNSIRQMRMTGRYIRLYHMNKPPVAFDTSITTTTTAICIRVCAWYDITTLVYPSFHALRGVMTFAFWRFPCQIQTKNMQRLRVCVRFLSTEHWAYSTWEQIIRMEYRKYLFLNFWEKFKILLIDLWLKICVCLFVSARKTSKQKEKK